MSDNLRKRQFDSLLNSQGYASEDENKKQSFGWVCVRLTMSAFCGLIFGFALEKGRVFEPFVIRDQMLFVRFVMLKMFLAASASSMFSFSILAMLPATHQYLARATQAFISGFVNKGVLSSVLGGTILGMGMTLSGACPGMVLAQVGAGTGNALYTLMGGLCGALAYGMLEPAIVRATKPDSSITQHFLHQHMGGPYFTLALPFVAILGMVVFAVELYVPWTSEVPTRGEGFLSCLSWPPYLAGAVIGLLQIPTVLFHKDSLGSSTSYCTVMSQGFRAALQKVCPYLSKYQSGTDNWWQVMYVLGAVGGAYLSSSLSGSIGSTPGVSPLAGFLGGALMLFGSRLAAGCTSGHGLSGMGLLSLLSFVTVPAMFAGGITTAIFLNSF